jgi:hypothetical protein
LDFARDDLDYCTVDIDFGCDIIFKNRTADIVGPVEPKLIAKWLEVHNDNHLRLGFFQNRQRCSGSSQEKILFENLPRLSYTQLGYPPAETRASVLAGRLSSLPTLAKPRL